MRNEKRDRGKKHNHLAAAEMGEEENYNMIDGIINNTPKPSVIEKIREYENRIAENANDDSEADGNKPKLNRSEREEL